MGGDAVPLSGHVRGDDYAHGVIALLTGFEATQHVSSNHLVSVDGDAATCICYTHATHYLPHQGGHPWLTIGARYDIDARRLPERGHAVLDQRPAIQSQQLLRPGRADALTRAAAQHDRHHPHEPDSNR